MLKSVEDTIWGTVAGRPKASGHIRRPLFRGATRLRRKTFQSLISSYFHSLISYPKFFFQYSISS